MSQVALVNDIIGLLFLATCVGCFRLAWVLWREGRQ